MPDHNRKKIFFSADWHVGNRRVIEFDERPFRDVDHMHRVLINNHNACVDDNSVCYFLGDMGLTKTDTLKSVINQLNGTKVLVIGNHDKGSNAMYNLGFDVVLHGAILYIANKRVSLSHCPLRGVSREDTTGMRGCDGSENWHGEYKNERYSMNPDCDFHLHGHIHSRPGRSVSKRIEGNQFDVGVAANHYRPVSISEIESWIVKFNK